MERTQLEAVIYEKDGPIAPPAQATRMDRRRVVAPKHSLASIGQLDPPQSSFPSHQRRIVKDARAMLERGHHTRVLP
jgi:hypothetical protein